MPADQRTYPINAKISEAAAARLKRIARQNDQSYGQVLDDLILNTATADSGDSGSTDDLVSRIEALEFKASGDDLADLVVQIETLATQLTALETRLTANPAELPAVSTVIAELKQAGLTSIEIADELNQRGHRTNRGTPYNPAYVRKMMGS
jgi:hypothetical protein